MNYGFFWTVFIFFLSFLFSLLKKHSHDFSILVYEESNLVQ